MKTVCVVLNYNDAATTLAMVKSVSGYQVLDEIVVVDNCSTDDSWKQLKQLKCEHVHVISTRKNGGYGYGNNIGIRYAYQKLGADFVLVSNPDVEVTKDCLLSMKRVLEEEEDCAVVSAMVKGPDGSDQFSCWKVWGWFGDMLDTGLVTRRLFRHLLQDNRYKHGKTEVTAQPVPYLQVDAVPGSLFMGRVSHLMECGLYDEHVFLYYEEKILAQKLKSHGFRTLLLTGESYIHHHSVSINKSVGSILKKQNLQHQSKLYYYQRYLRVNPLFLLLSKIALAFLMAEIWFLTKILGMRW